MNGDEQFANDMLHFAARRFNAPESQSLTVVVVHVPNQDRWFELYLYVVIPSGGIVMQEYSVNWSGIGWDLVDGYCTIWHRMKGLTSGMRTKNLVKDVEQRRSIAKQWGFYDFDPDLAERAIQFDAIIFVNDEEITRKQKEYAIEHYLELLITHECINIIEEFSNQRIIVGHDLYKEIDKPTRETYDAYTQAQLKGQSTV